MEILFFGRRISFPSISKTIHHPKKGVRAHDFFKSFHSGLTFLSELAALAAFGYWGFRLPRGIFLKLFLGIGTPLTVAVIWGMFIAPKAAFPAGLPIRILLKVIVYTLSAWALDTAGQSRLAIYFLAVSLLLVAVTHTFKMSIE